MNAPPFPPFPPFPTNPALGQQFGTWAWNGSCWVPSPASGMIVKCTVFWQNGSYMPSPGLTALIVEAVGGGAGGGGALATFNGTAGWVGGGGGGASGGFSRITLPASLVAGGVNIMIGAGGVAGSELLMGGAGGTTSFGALCVANGGEGGWPFNPALPHWGGGGYRNVNQGVGDITSLGSAGENGTGVFNDDGISGGQAYGGRGGDSSIYGGTGAGGVALVGGGADDGSIGFQGGGGSGGASGTAGQPAQGAAGGDGRVIVTEFIWSVGAGGDGGDGGGGARVPFGYCEDGA